MLEETKATRCLVRIKIMVQIISADKCILNFSYVPPYTTAIKLHYRNHLSSIIDEVESDKRLNPLMKSQPAIEPGHDMLNSKEIKNTV